MNGQDIGFWLGAFGSVASLVGLAIAVRAEHRARSAEAKVDAAVRRTKRLLLVAEIAAGTVAAHGCLNERRSGRVWESYRRAMRTSVVRLRESDALSADERALLAKALNRTADARFGAADSDRHLRRVLDDLDTLHTRLLNLLADAEP